PKPVFFDPGKKRWKRLRILLNVAGVLSTALIIAFAISMWRPAVLASLGLPDLKAGYRPVKEKPAKRPSPHRKRPETKASEVVLNSGDPVRAAFYVMWDAGSFSALKQYGHQIDLLFPEFLHAFTPDGRLQALAEGSRMVDIIRGGGAQVADPD